MVRKKVTKSRESTFHSLRSTEATGGRDSVTGHEVLSVKGDMELSPGLPRNEPREGGTP